MRRIRGWLRQVRAWPYWAVVAVVVVGLSASVLLDLLQARLQPWTIGLLRGIAYLATVGFSAMFAFRRGKAADKERIREQKTAQLERLLYSTVDTLFPSEEKSTIRSNIMVVKGSELAILAGSNMRLWPDREIRFGYAVGCCGVAWKQAIEARIDEVSDPVYAPDATAGDWRLSSDQKRLTGHVLWVLSIPLFDRRGNTRDFVGVLNLDGVSGPLKKPDRLESHDLLSTLLRLAEQLAADVREVGENGT